MTREALPARTTASAEPAMSAAAVEPNQTKPKEKPAPLPGRDYPWYSPRFWHGMSLRPWLKLLAENRFRLHPARVPMAATVTTFAFTNSLWRLLQNAIHGSAIQRTEVKEPPVFILGHWRSGTTYLHELLAHDERFATPTSYQCFQPHHFLLTQPIVTKLFWWLMPSKRPQDNVELGWNTPQEDEFALCAMGLPTPYRRMAFPNNGPVDLNYLNMQGLAADELQQWQDGLQWFAKLITYHTGKRLLLKSPPHTGRAAVLCQMFPGAKFIHLSRDPYALFPSTVKLWRALHFAQGFQLSEGDDLEEYIFTCLETMYSDYNADGIVHLRYEDLIADPVAHLKQAYQTLGLDGFEQVEPKLAKYAASKRSYRPNVHKLEDTTRKAIAQRWKFYFDQFGYEF